ncbi:hypothetical protein VPHK290_0035 [Vibrio phage K290]
MKVLLSLLGSLPDNFTYYHSMCANNNIAINVIACTHKSVQQANNIGYPLHTCANPNYLRK